MQDQEESAKDREVHQKLLREKAYRELDRDTDEVYGGFKVEEDFFGCDECGGKFPIGTETTLGDGRDICESCALDLGLI